MKDYDLYKYIVKINVSEMIKQYNIDLININREFKGDFTIMCDAHLMAIDKSLINWNNCYIFIRYNYIIMLKYKELLEKCINKEEHEAFDYWYKKYIEETIKGLNELYDKSFHIINYMFDLDCKEGIHFKSKIFKSLKLKDKKAYKIISNINDKYKNCIGSNRHNIEHNSSDLFPKIEYKNHGTEFIYKSYANMSSKQAFDKVNILIDILKEEAYFIQKNLAQQFPNRFGNID